MHRLILRYQRSGAAPAADVARLRGIHGCEIVDETRRMILVDTTAEAQAEIRRFLPDWLIAAEQSDIRIPDPRPKIRSNPATPRQNPNPT